MRNSNSHRFHCPVCGYELPYPEEIFSDNDYRDKYIRCDRCGSKIYADGSVEYNDDYDEHGHYNDKDYFDMYDR